MVARVKKLILSVKNKCNEKALKNAMIAVTFLLSLVTVKVALASTSNDVDLTSLDSSVEGHLQGDWGRLVAYVALGLGILWSAVKQNYLVLMGAIIILLALAFGPTIIDSATGG